MPILKCHNDRRALVPASDFETFTPRIRDLDKKQRVTSQSLHKIEEGARRAYAPHSSGHDILLSFLAAYAIAVRSSEYNVSPELLDDVVSRHISGLNAYGGEDRIPRKRGRGDLDDEEENRD